MEAHTINDKCPMVNGEKRHYYADADMNAVVYLPDHGAYKIHACPVHGEFYGEHNYANYCPKCEREAPFVELVTEPRPLRRWFRPDTDDGIVEGAELMRGTDRDTIRSRLGRVIW